MRRRFLPCWFRPRHPYIALMLACCAPGISLASDTAARPNLAESAAALTLPAQKASTTPQHPSPDRRVTTLLREWRQATAGDPTAMLALGRRLLAPGQGSNPEQARTWLKRAADAGASDALLELAALAGQRPTPDPALAHQLTQQAATQGNARAMLLLGRQLQRGYGTTPDPQAARLWFRQAVAAGELEAYADLGYIHEAGLGVEQDLEQAIRIYRRGVTKDSPAATRSLATLYEQGLGVRRNMDRALQLYLKAAALGDQRAKASLAILANNGMLTSMPDPERGASMLAQAVADSSDADYIYRLAQMTEKGVGRTPDPAAAARLYRRAARLGHVAALAELAALYKLGQGVPQDTRRALTYWQRSAQAGDPESHYNLAVTYAESGDDAANQEAAGRHAWLGAQAGNSEAMTLHARNLYFGAHGQRQDSRSAFAWLEQALAAHNGWAAGTLYGLATSDGLEAPPQDRDRALLILVQAAMQNNNPVAEEALRMVYREREGVDLHHASQQTLIRRLTGPQRGMAALLLGLGHAQGRFGAAPDPQQAASYLRTAIAAGEFQAHRYLGDLQASGALPGIGPADALRQYQAGARHGDTAAMNDLGVAYLRGEGTDANPAQAFLQFRNAAERGHPMAMYNLAICYQHGRGVPASSALAEAWFERAIARGNPQARYGLAYLLLALPAGERDYTRALFHLAALSRQGDTAAAALLGALVADTHQPPGVRQRAQQILDTLDGEKGQ